MRSAVLEALAERDRAGVERHLRCRHHRRGHVVFNEGDPADGMHFVAAGRFVVQASTAPAVTVTLRVVHPGEFFGELALIEPPRCRATRVSALEDGETMVLTRRDYAGLRHTHPGVERLLVEALVARLDRVDELVKELVMPREQRIWRRLAVLADAYGDEPVHLSQLELARATGFVRQTVNRALRRAELAGVVQLSRGSVRVLDHAALLRLAAGVGPDEHEGDEGHAG